MFQLSQLSCNNITTDLAKTGVGLSNVFVPQPEVERYWEELLRQITILYPSLHIVGYEQAESLTIASHLGFTSLGPLRVWIKEGGQE